MTLITGARESRDSCFLAHAPRGLTAATQLRRKDNWNPLGQLNFYVPRGTTVLAAGVPNKYLLNVTGQGPFLIHNELLNIREDRKTLKI